MEPLRGRTLVIYNSDHPMIAEILNLLKTANTDILASHDPKLMNKAISEKYAQWHQIINKVIVILSPSVWDYGVNEKPGDAYTKAQQSTVFELGFWLGKVGRDRLVAIFYDQKRFRIPCEFFDCRLIAWQKNNLWKKELEGFMAE